ncbi:MAG TPA: helicase-related protein [Xanthobacteraceae bacterium]|nr:helicase-related protein [Xanthobacteraceae bacterium]
MSVSLTPIPPAQRGRGVTAVLGPTNTGKTHLAIERMLAHSSGVIGLPLRLLAREVYNRAVERVGAGSVALITGEEKIKPANARYWVSTVEAMPQDLDVAFVALDEVQLAADLERGHVFTDRMLNRRGREETLVLGAATMRGLIERLLPGVNVVQRPRLSNLIFSGDKKITRLPRRSAIVAFSSEEVYAIAELIRRQRGGAAVVLGALSPRTRNAQVDMYQAGDVDYLVATDAIGMGLNLDVDHVAFASDRKFDGYQFRNLNPAEFAQIAGRAGRHSRDGTFGTTGRCGPFDAELVAKLENHEFEPVRIAQWRSSTLDFRSIKALLMSLAAGPREEGLVRAPLADDVLVLEHAAKDKDSAALATTPAAVERLWEACQLPDYRKIAPAAHAELAMTLYGFLMRKGRIPAEWIARQIDHADRTDGDIDTLSNRIAQVRTWTFAANRADWLDDPEHWQGVARAVEDRLSDALHERLTQRFVDRRTSVLLRRLRENTTLETEITKTGDVVVEGHIIGHLSGFEFSPADASGDSEAKALRGAAQKALASEIENRATKLAEAGDEVFVLTADGTLRWSGDPVAKLIPADDVLEPRLRILADEQLTGPVREKVEERLVRWMKAHVEKLLGPLVALGKAGDVTGIARGVAFQLVEAFGVLERAKVADEVKGLDQPTRAILRQHGVRFGAHHIYMPALLKPAPRALSTLLWALKNGGLQQKGVDDLPALAASGRTSIPVDPEIAKPLYRLAGYRVCGARAIRVDILERLADLIRPALAWRPGMQGDKPAGAFDGRGFTVTVAMTSLVGCAGEDFAAILRALGYRMDRRPAPAEPAAAEAAPSDTPTETQTEAAAATETAATEAPSEAPAEASVETPSEVPAAETSAAAETPAETAAPENAGESASTEPGAEASAAAATAEPATIEVWRPGRPPGERRAHRSHDRERKRPQHVSLPAQGGESTAAEGEAKTHDARRERKHDERKHDGARRHDRKPRHDNSRNERSRDKPRREYHERRDKPIDPNSPFAALLQLKARMQSAGESKDEPGKNDEDKSGR